MPTQVAPEEVRRTLNQDGREHTVVIYFTKRDGSRRRMVCRYFGALSPKASLMRVWDLEKGAPRTINLDTVENVRVLGVSRPAKTPKSQQSFEDVRDEMQELFGF